jgi:hypothetical protein
MRRKERPAGNANGQVIAVTRDTGELLNQWGRYGRQPGRFKGVHNPAIDSQAKLRRGRIRAPGAEVQARN